MLRRNLLLLVGLVLLGLSASAQQNQAVDGEGHAWWQHAVFYEIYPRSFADSDHDGIGDLAGITSKLDYLQDLGVDAIWLTPCFPSPQVDFGYDVSDYENIDPRYGSLADFDRLVSEARKRGIRIVMDFVMNHSSDRHPWFIESSSSRTSSKRDWYVWRDGPGPNRPPNNWVSTFGGPAWKLDPHTQQFYYHFFYPEQPDLNWSNPVVKQAMFDVTRYWYKRGVAGFRLDAVDTLFEDPQLRDNPVKPGKNKYGDPNQENIHNTKLPEVHTVLRELRKVAEEYGAVLIGETWTPDIESLKQYYGEHGDELQMPMDFLFTTVNKLSPPEFRRQIAAVDSAGGWPVFVLSNHDIVRHYVRYGDGKNNDQITKLMAALYLTLRGTPILYYGEEVGMENRDPQRKEDVQDPIGKLGWPLEKGRDGERTPMHWDTTANAGFSPVKPWLPVAPNYPTHNVRTQSKDSDSILSFYRQLLRLRHEHPALLEGRYVALNEQDPNILVYLRQFKDRAVLVALNMSPRPQTARVDLTLYGYRDDAALTTLVSAPRNQSHPSTTKQISLRPYGVVIAEVSKAQAGSAAP